MEKEDNVIETETKENTPLLKRDKLIIIFFVLTGVLFGLSRLSVVVSPLFQIILVVLGVISLASLLTIIFKVKTGYTNDSMFKTEEIENDATDLLAPFLIRVNKLSAIRDTSLYFFPEYKEDNLRYLFRPLSVYSIIRSDIKNRWMLKFTPWRKDANFEELFRDYFNFFKINSIRFKNPDLILKTVSIIYKDLKKFSQSHGNNSVPRKLITWMETELTLLLDPEYISRAQLYRTEDPLLEPNSVISLLNELRPNLGTLIFDECLAGRMHLHHDCVKLVARKLNQLVFLIRGIVEQKNWPHANYLFVKENGERIDEHSINEASYKDPGLKEGGTKSPAYALLNLFIERYTLKM